MRRRTLLVAAASVVLVGEAAVATAALAGLSGTATAVSREPFTLVMIPDTQIAVQDWPEFFYAQTQWIANNRDTLGIRYAIHVGDIVEWPRTADWGRARTGMSTLDGRVPYVVAIGNHDFDKWPGGEAAIAADRTCGNFNTYLPRSKFAAWPTFGSTYPATANDNSFHKFTAGGTDWGVLTLKYKPTDAELAWGAGIVQANPARQFIVNTHDYMNGTARSEAGNRIWNSIANAYPNVVLVLNGHYVNCGERADLDSAGNTVFEVMADYQHYETENRYENSYLRIMTFDPRVGTMSVRTYSPYLNQYKTDVANQFTLSGVPFPPGAARVRRHVVSQASLAAWRCGLGEVWTLPDTELTGYPEGTALPAAPSLVQATGDPAVYLVDGATKRHVASTRVLAAWRWTSGDVAARTPAQVAAMPQGPDVVEYPYLVKGSGPAVYVLDAPG